MTLSPDLARLMMSCATFYLAAYASSLAMEIVDAAVQPMRLSVYAPRFVRLKPNATNGNG
jgi:hypothetical protein